MNKCKNCLKDTYNILCYECSEINWKQQWLKDQELEWREMEQENRPCQVHLKDGIAWPGCSFCKRAS